MISVDKEAKVAVFGSSRRTSGNLGSRMTNSFSGVEETVLVPLSKCDSFS